MTTPLSDAPLSTRVVLGLYGAEPLYDLGGIGERISDQAREKANEAVKFADGSPVPDISDLTRDVYWETDHATESSKTGRHFFGD